MPRKQAECYASKWCTFTPLPKSYIKMLFPQDIEAWAEKSFPPTYSIEDFNALKLIQDTLYY